MPDSQRTQKLVVRLRARDGDGCFYCGTEMEFIRPAHAIIWSSRWRATVEHLIDVSVGGTKQPSNCVLAHRKCNNDRSHIKDLGEKLRTRAPEAPPIPPAVQWTIDNPELARTRMVTHREELELRRRPGKLTGSHHWV